MVDQSDVQTAGRWVVQTAAQSETQKAGCLVCRLVHLKAGCSAVQTAAQMAGRSAVQTVVLTAGWKAVLRADRLVVPRVSHLAGLKATPKASCLVARWAGWSLNTEAPSPTMLTGCSIQTVSRQVPRM